jgi:hypothetical protein
MKFCFLLMLLPLTALAQVDVQWITLASGVRARAAAVPTAEELARLPIGTLLRQLDNEQRAATILGKQDFWYHVALPNGKAGWVFGAFLKRFDAALKGEIYREIGATKAKAENATYAESADLARFLTAVGSEITTRTEQAEIELWRWMAIQKALEQIPADKLQQAEYQRFIKTWQAQLVYSEPGGSWLVKTDVLWNLHKKSADLPVAEMIAWEAANLPMPGECEGDDLCMTMAFNTSLGRYLKLYPTGKYVAPALDRLIDVYQFVNQQMENVALPQSQSAEDIRLRKEARAAYAQMRANLAEVTNPKKDRFLQIIAQCEKQYQAKP